MGNGECGIAGEASRRETSTPPFRIPHSTFRISFLAVPLNISRTKLIIAAALALPIVGFVLYTWASLSWSYSVGERAGYVQKFSAKGWICKTWEGELAMVSLPGTMPEKFLFSVRNDSVAHLINADMGKRVSLTYHQHKGVPTRCFGETEYFVTGVRVVE